MKISIRWVREFCPFKTRESPAEIGVRFSLATAEVEGVEVRGQGLESIVAARVVGVRPHPASGTLSIARLELNGAESREVVCGAPNVKVGLLAPYAPPGAHVGGREVKTASIRGVDSPGMLLSQAELGISDAAGTLWELPPETVPGAPLARLFPELEDTVLEVDNKSLTHRPDLWGHHGIAREFSVIYGTPLASYPLREELARAAGDPGIRVEIEPGSSSRCPRYCGLRVEGVRVGPSPAWMRHRLLAVGIRPISNVVDVTNYVMYELGQPLHAFDAARLRGGLIRVRRAAPGESLRLLNGTEVRLTAEDLVIADAAGPVALAGVMGGEGSEISEATTSLFLESASFEAAGLRRTALRTVRTDSSARFEKSLDPENARAGILRAAALILELCPGARVAGRLQDVGWTPREPPVIEVSPRGISRRLGTAVPARRIRAILEGLGFGIEERSADDWRVKVPSWRATRDISLAEDLMEEVGRHHGYGRIKPFAPLWPVEPPPLNEERRLERRAKAFLCLHGGLTEVYTYSMVGAAHCRLFGLDPEHCLKLQNPMSEELDRLRREIVPIHLEKARENRRFFESFGFFELGRVYLKDPARLRERELPRENRRIAGVICRPRKSDASFQFLRHLALSLSEHLGARGAEAVPLEPDRAWIHPAAAARVVHAGRELGSFYRIHPAVEARLELTGDTLAFDLDFDALAAVSGGEALYRRLPRFPWVTFDVAVEAPERTPAASIEEVIRRAAGESLRRLECFDVYRGPNLPPGMKSLAFHVAVGAEDHTLTTAEAESLRAKVLEALGAAGFKLRA